MNRDLIHIVILAKHALVSAGIRRLLEDQQGIKVIGETSDFRAGLEIIADLKPDIILLELNPIKQTDLDYIPHITAANKLSRIILLTEDQDYHVLVRAVENGVLGLVSKTQKPETLIKAIMKVSTGEVWLERSMIAHVLSRLSSNQELIKTSVEKTEINQLSKREKEVIVLIAEGFKNKEIAAQLNISEATVRHHLTSIYNKVQVSDRLELLVYAYRFGFLENPHQ